MFSVEPYQRWIQSPGQSEQPLSEKEWTTIRVARHKALRELLAPLKEKVKDAVGDFYAHLTQIDQAFIELLRARQASFDLHRHHSTLFDELRVPDHLATPTGQALLREYVDLVNSNTGSRCGVAGIVGALGALKSDLEHYMEQERMTRALAAEQARQQLVQLIRNPNPLLALESLVDTDRASAGAVFSELRGGLEMLSVILSESRAGDSDEQRLEECLTRVQSAFNSLLRVTKGCESLSEAVLSEQLVLAGLGELVKKLYPELPRPAFSYPSTEVSKLHGLSSDERQAYLVVLRHLDVIRTSQAEQDDFRQIAVQERDWLLKDMISRLGVGGANDCIREQVEKIHKDDRALVESIGTLIVDANKRLEEELERIQAEAKIEEGIARYLASQRFDGHDLNELVGLFTADSDLHQCFAKVLQGDEFRKGGSLDELRDYLNTLSAVLRDARTLSPVLIESILLLPATEFASRSGLDAFSKHLKALSNAPETLRAREFEALVEMTASILEANFPYGNHVSDQYRVAARVVIFGLAPQLKDRELDRPVRDGTSIANLVSRSTRTPLSFAIVNDTIQTHLLPHIIVCKNQSELNPVKRRYQLLRTPDERLAPIVAHLEYIARRPVSTKRKGPSSQAAATRQGQPSHAKTKSSGTATKQAPLDPREKELKQLLAMKSVLERQLPYLEEKCKQIATRCDALASLSDPAQQLQPLVERLSSLSSRLSSSLRNNLSYVEQASYRDEFDKYCFSRLRDQMGFTPFGLPSRIAKALARKITFSELRELVLVCALERYPGIQAIFNEAKCTRAELSAIGKDLLSHVFGNSRQATAQLRAAIATCLDTNSAKGPDRLAILSQGFELIQHPERLAEIQVALKECHRTAQQQLADVGSAIVRVSGQTSNVQDESQGQGGEYGNA
jgi:hypothetical protein